MSNPYYTITLNQLTHVGKWEWIVNFMTPDLEYIRVASGLSETVGRAQDCAAEALTEHSEALGALT